MAAQCCTTVTVTEALVLRLLLEDLEERKDRVGQFSGEISRESMLPWSEFHRNA